MARLKNLFFGSSRSEQGMIYLEKFAGVAQLVEQLICNQPVGSSSLSTSLLNLNRVLDTLGRDF